MPTVPNCARKTLSAATAEQMLNALEDFVENDAIYWEVDDTATDALIIANIDNGDRLGFERTAGTITMYYEPDVMNSWDPADLDGTRSSDASSGGDSTDANIGTVAWFIETVDMITMFVRDGTSDRMRWGLHAGVIFRTFHEGLPFDGKGFLTGLPQIQTGSGAGSWISATSGNRSQIRFNGTWYALAPTSLRASTLGVSGLTGDVEGFETFPPVAAVSIGNNRSLAVTRYLCDASSSEVNRVVRPSTSSDQAWMHYIFFGTTTQASCIIWNKTVTP
jgi:hypothetical protein